MSQERGEEFEGFLARAGFIWGPEPEIYDPLAGFYTYGPNGKAVKNNIESEMRAVFKEHGFSEVEAPVIMPRSVWKASGHLDSFVDPLVRCSDCGKTYRADKLIEEEADVDVADGFSDQELLDRIEEEDIRCKSCGSKFEEEVEDYNLMMKTTIGEDIEAYNRPETATTTYLPFKRYYRHFRKDMPIKVFQIGKAFRNEISPRQNVLRGREFTQAEGQIFVDPEQKDSFELDGLAELEIAFWSAENQEKGEGPAEMTLEDAYEEDLLGSSGYAWCIGVAYRLFSEAGVPAERMRFREHQEDEKAHYAREAWDLEIETDSFGWTECCGVHDRGDYDLGQHTDHSEEELKVSEDGRDYIPHILEIAFGTDRPTFAVVDIGYNSPEESDRGKELLKLKRSIAPLDAAVFPLVDKDGLPEIAREVTERLRKAGLEVRFDSTGSIGKRYARHDMIGTPACVTVDYDSKDDRSVTIRNRDSTGQIRVEIDELPRKLERFIGGEELEKLE